MKTNARVQRLVYDLDSEAVKGLEPRSNLGSNIHKFTTEDASYMTIVSESQSYDEPVTIEKNTLTNAADADSFYSMIISPKNNPLVKFKRHDSLIVIQDDRQQVEVQDRRPLENWAVDSCLCLTIKNAIGLFAALFVGLALVLIVDLKNLTGLSNGAAVANIFCFIAMAGSSGLGLVVKDKYITFTATIFHGLSWLLNVVMLIASILDLQNLDKVVAIISSFRSNRNHGLSAIKDDAYDGLMILVVTSVICLFTVPYSAVLNYSNFLQLSK